MNWFFKPHEKLLIPISTAELIIISNLGRGIGSSIEFTDNNGRTREYPLYIVVKYAKESYFELAKFVTTIAKKYSLDIPIRGGGSTFEIPEVGIPRI